MNSPETLREWIEQIQEHGRGLTTWEREFVESLSEQLESWGRLSPRQEEILERIYAEKTPL